MATLKQFYYKVLLDDGTLESRLPDGVSNFFGTNLLGTDTTSKISIQAPPGTMVQLDNKEIIIGRSGIYDFDNTEITISSLVFPTPTQYERDRPNQNDLNTLQGFLQQIKGYLNSLISNTQSGTTEEWKTFCLTGQKIYYGERNTTSSQSIYNFNFNNTTLYGFSQVLAEYLKIVDGELKITYTDVMNVIVNYIAND